jgi:hypothetical protein
MKKEVNISNRDVTVDHGYVEKQSGVPFVAPYWCVPMSADEEAVNMVHKTKDITITVDMVNYKISVPVLQNTRALKADAHLYKVQVAAVNAKASSVSAAAGKAKAKAKVKPAAAKVKPDAGSKRRKTS